MQFRDYLLEQKEKDSGIVQHPSETTPGMLYVILSVTAKKPTHLRNFKLEQLHRKAVRVIYSLETTKYNKCFISSVQQKKKSQEEVQILSISTDETSSRKG